MTLKIDGTDFGDTGGGTSQSMQSQGLTTTQNNDLIIAFITITTVNGRGGFNGISDSAGLTWNSRVTGLAGPSQITDIEVWYAVAATPLSADIITVALGIGAGNNAQASMVIFAVSGSIYSNPFDANSSLPAHNSNASSGTSSVTISTSHSYDMLIGLVGMARSGNAISAVSLGFTEIVNDQAGPSTDSEYNVVNSTQTNLNLTCVLELVDEWVMLGDAIQGSAPPPPAQQYTVIYNQNTAILIAT
jgi:hypothetical protein